MLYMWVGSLVMLLEAPLSANHNEEEGALGNMCEVKPNNCGEGTPDETHSRKDCDCKRTRSDSDSKGKERDTPGFRLKAMNEP